MTAKIIIEHILSRGSSTVSTAENAQLLRELRDELRIPLGDEAWLKNKLIEFASAIETKAKWRRHAFEWLFGIVLISLAQIIDANPRNSLILQSLQAICWLGFLFASFSTVRTKARTTDQILEVLRARPSMKRDPLYSSDKALVAPSPSTEDATTRLRTLKSLLENGLITQDDFEKKKQEILKTL